MTRRFWGATPGSARRVAYRLYPTQLDDLKLETALRLYCEEFGDREGIAVEFTSQDAPPAFPREIARCLYRVPEEDLRNIAKHAQATRIAFAFVSRIPAAGFGFRRFGRHPQH